MPHTNPYETGGADDQALPLALADQRRRWPHGERVLVENYLSSFPALLKNREDVLDLIYSEIFLREQQGEPATLEEYARRFPDLAAELRVQFEVHNAIQPADSAPRQAASPNGERHAAPEQREVAGLELLEEIGRGSMGVVYRARHPVDGRLFAVKMLLSQHVKDAAVRKRFLAEARAVVTLDHPHIVRVYQAGESGQRLYQVMDLIDGPALAEIVAKGPLSFARAVATLLPVIDAVEHAHRQGIIHRDLKPSNIMLDRVRGPLVVDFGMAKALGKTALLSTTGAGTILGTPAFMPPEQAGQDMGRAGPYSDVYSLGAILYMMLAGRPPFFEANALLTIVKVRSAEPAPPLASLRPDVPDELAAICHRCLNKKPAERYGTAQELARELRLFS